MRLHGLLKVAHIELCIGRRLLARQYTTTSLLSPSDYTENLVSLAVGNNGSVTLNILQPIASAGSNQNVILYLPPGPIFQRRDPRSDDISEAEKTSPQHILASKTLSTVVTLSYRLGYHPTLADPEKTFFYPTPVHDTITGFDWVIKNLLPPLSAKKKGWVKHQHLEARSQEPHLCVYGSHIGGSLATMLALTETKHIHAIAVHEPVVDWVGLDDYLEAEEKAQAEAQAQQYLSELSSKSTIAETKATRKPRRRTKVKANPTDLEELVSVRSEIFKKPEIWFDPFASPALFLRAAGRDAPIDWSKYWNFDTEATEQQFRSLNLEHNDNYPGPSWDTLPTASTSSPYSSLDIDPQLLPPTPPPTPPEPKKHRKALRSWPPFVVGEMPSKLPMMRVSVSEDDASVRTDVIAGRPRKRRNITPSRILASQSQEIVSLMRKCCFWGRDKETGLAERRVGLVVVGRGSPDNDSKASANGLDMELEAVDKAGDWFWDGAPEFEIEQKGRTDDLAAGVSEPLAE